MKLLAVFLLISQCVIDVASCFKLLNLVPCGTRSGAAGGWFPSPRATWTTASPSPLDVAFPIAYHLNGGTQLQYQQSSSSGNYEGANRFNTPASRRPSSFDSPVLRQVYPALVAFKQRFGHVNIPLGSSDGRKCETLRRLQIQGKLSQRDFEALDELRFRWHSLEDVYHTVNFADLYRRLLEYGIENGGDLSVPKKYAPDPELGAWVTGVRRVGRAGVEPNHAEALDEVGFPWESPRMCGSSFMKRYREIKEMKDKEDPLGTAFLSDEKVQAWIRAQQEAAKRGSLSETRKQYMEKLVPGWLEWEP
jgi:hypothetical protein